MRGSLSVVGTGIQLSHISIEARAAIASVDKLLHLVADPVTASWLAEQNPSAESLHHHYSLNKDRSTSYEGMVEEILGHVRLNKSVCVAFYGHPGVFAYPSHESIRRARNEGYTARMLPGISTEACLIADLGIDPGTNGCQSYEATDFLIHKRSFDPRSGLILWQIGVIGVAGCVPDQNADRLQILAECLALTYGRDHEAIVYQASQFCICEPVVDHIRVCDIPMARITPLCTLYVPPLPPAEPDRSMLVRLCGRGERRQPDS